MIDALGGLFYFLIALGILVTIHEFGHFIVARACGVKVLRFSIGFGPILFKRTAKNGCEYAVSAIPLGGYVKMEGENEILEKNAPLSKDSFKAQSVWKRALIIFAGPFFNIVLAVILLTIINVNGVQERKTIVGPIAPNSVAYNAGFKAYDEIIAIDSQAVSKWNDVFYELFDSFGKDKNLLVDVKGDFGKAQTRTLELNLKNLTIERNEDPINKIGLTVCFGKVTNQIGLILENSPASKTSLAVGDEVVSIDGMQIESWYDIRAAIEKSNGNELSFVIKRNGNLYSQKVTPKLEYDKRTHKSLPFVGIGAKVEKVEGLSYKVEYGLLDGFFKACKDSVAMSKLIVTSVTKLIDGTIAASNISGPIAIAKGAQESASFGIIVFLGFLAAISVNLGILNLLPIPVLDGGQLLFLLYEAIARKEPTKKVQLALTSIGAGLLFTLMFFAVFNDILGLMN